MNSKPTRPAVRVDLPRATQLAGRPTAPATFTAPRIVGGGNSNTLGVHKGPGLLL